MTVHSPPPSPTDLEEPPLPPERVLTVGLIGVGLVVSAFILGLASGAPLRGFDAHWADGPRTLLAALGLFLAGCAVSMRPGWYGGWLCAAAAGLIGYGVGAQPPAGTEWYLSPPRDWYAGVPNAWDSVQLFFGVFGAFALVGAIWTRLPRKAVYACILIWVCYHYAGIMSAVTSPPPMPWMTDQYWKRVGSPYLQFAYMNNAYQFYSPDPGPATELWVLIEYRPEGSADDAESERECIWHIIPHRSEDYVDPLGLSYYRRLSLTENLAQFQASYMSLAPELKVVQARREKASRESGGRDIPRVPATPEYERPNELVSRQLLPSFARHLAHEYARPGKEVRSVKIYRARHQLTTLAQFRGFDPTTGQSVMPVDPFMPSLYIPNFQGEFDGEGQLKDSTEPLLYWYVPIYNSRSNNPLPATLEEYKRNIRRHGPSYYFTDTVSRHARCERPVEEGRK